MHGQVYLCVHTFVGCCLATKVFIGSYLEAEVVEEVIGWLGLVGTATANKIGMHLPMQLMYPNSCHATIMYMYIGELCDVGLFSWCYCYVASLSVRK